MNDYTYVNPLDKGAVKIKISNKDHDALIGKAFKRSIFTKYELYLYPDKIEICKFSSLLTKILELILFPVGIFMYGFPEWKRAMGNLFHERRDGHFSSIVAHATLADGKFKQLKLASGHNE